MEHHSYSCFLVRLVIRAIEEGEPYSNDFRVVAPTGKIRWMANLGPLLDPIIDLSAPHIRSAMPAKVTA